MKLGDRIKFKDKTNGNVLFGVITWATPDGKQFRFNSDTYMPAQVENIEKVEG